MTALPPSDPPQGTAKLRRPHAPQVQTQEHVEATFQKAASAEPVDSGASSGQTPSPLSGDVIIDMGDGLTKTEKAEALVAAYRERETAARMKAEAEALMSQAQIARQIAQAYNGMSPERQRHLQNALLDPSKLDSLGQPPAPQDEVQFFPQQESRRQDDPRLQQALDLLERHNSILMGLGQERAQVTLNQRVDAAMQQWPVFREDPALAEMAKESVLNQQALNPQASLDSLVQGAAHKFAQYVQASRKRQVGEMGLSPVSGSSPQPKFKPDRHALKSGAISRFITEQTGLI